MYRCKYNIWFFSCFLKSSSHIWWKSPLNLHRWVSLMFVIILIGFLSYMSEPHQSDSRWVMRTSEMRLCCQGRSQWAKCLFSRRVWSHCDVRWGSLQHLGDGVSCRGFDTTTLACHILQSTVLLTYCTAQENTDALRNTDNEGFLSLYWADGVHDPQMASWSAGHTLVLH